MITPTQTFGGMVGLKEENKCAISHNLINLGDIAKMRAFSSIHNGRISCRKIFKTLKIGLSIESVKMGTLARSVPSPEIGGF